MLITQGYDAHANLIVAGLLDAAASSSSSSSPSSSSSHGFSTSSSSSHSSESSSSSISSLSSDSSSSSSSLSSDSSSSPSSLSSLSSNSSSSSQGFSSSSSLSSLSSHSSDSSSSDSSSSEVERTLPYLNPISVRNTYPDVYVNDTLELGPISQIDDTTHKYTLVQIIHGPVTVELESRFKDSEVRYTLNGKNPNNKSYRYTAPLVFRQNASGSERTVVKARIYDKRNSNVKSKIIRIEFNVIGPR